MARRGLRGHVCKYRETTANSTETILVSWRITLISVSFRDGKTCSRGRTGMLHDITQRGIRPFFCDRDYLAYIELMVEWRHASARADLRVLLDAQTRASVAVTRSGNRFAAVPGG